LPNGGILLLKVAEIPKFPTKVKKRDGSTYETFVCKFTIASTGTLIERNLGENDVTWSHDVGAEEVHLADAKEGDLWEAFESDEYRGKTYVNLRPSTGGSEPMNRQSAAKENRKSVKNEAEVSSQYNGSCFQCKCDSENCDKHKFEDKVKQRMISQAGFAQPALQGLLSRIPLDADFSNEVIDAIIDQAIKIGAIAAAKNKERALKDLMPNSAEPVVKEKLLPYAQYHSGELQIPDEVPPAQ